MSNPFDDDASIPSRPNGRSTNPFDSLRDASSQLLRGGAGDAPAMNTGHVSRSALLVHDHSSAANDGGGGGESSWMDLGDLPYRRVRLYSNVAWGRGGGYGSESRGGDAAAAPAKDKDATGGVGVGVGVGNGEEQFGLSWFPSTYVDTVRSHQNAVLGAATGPSDGLRGGAGVARLLSTTTTTFVAGCPNGGPIASVTVPLATGGAGFGPRTTIRIMSNDGSLLSSVPFPPRDLALRVQSGRLSLNRAPGDILTIGFTSRCVLVVVLRDSLTLCYDLSGNPVLPPFFALGRDASSPSGIASGGMDLMEARVFEGGVAVLGADMNSAVVELLDEFDDPSYADGADAAARRVAGTGRGDDPSTAASAMGAPASSSSSSPPPPPPLAPPPHYALVTPLPTGTFARSRHLSFQCVAVLPRQYAPSRRPELFLSTSDGSVVVSELLPSASPGGGITDVDCRSRMGGTADGAGGRASPVVSMAFAPNGRFLACYTSNSVLTVVSTNFESKVLEFDARSGSSSPPRCMGWCGEDSVVLHWKNLGVLMVGPYGDWLRFPYDDDADGRTSRDGNGNDTSGAGAEVYLVPEIDCCRVVRSSSVEILQRVPPGTADLLRIGSIEPGALLLDASDAFDSGSPNADEAARSITQTDGLLEEAIHQCVEAAVVSRVCSFVCLGYAALRQ